MVRCAIEIDGDELALVAATLDDLGTAKIYVTSYLVVWFLEPQQQADGKWFCVGHIDGETK